jgi:hypothetical protein
MATETKELKLRRGAVNTLNNLLQGTGWYDDSKTAYLAGSILVNAMPEIEEVPKTSAGQPVGGDGLKAWLNAELVLSLTAKQTKACKQCVEHFIKQKQLTINLYTFELMEKLGFKPDDE